MRMRDLGRLVKKLVRLQGAPRNVRIVGVRKQIDDERDNLIVFFAIKREGVVSPHLFYVTTHISRRKLPGHSHTTYLRFLAQSIATSARLLLLRIAWQNLEKLTSWSTTPSAPPCINTLRR